MNTFLIDGFLEINLIHVANYHGGRRHKGICEPPNKIVQINIPTSKFKILTVCVWLELL